MSKFKMKDLGTVEKFLGMRIIREKDRVIINQTKYIEQMLERFNMSNCKPVGEHL